MLVIYSSVILLGITLVCAMLGYWIDLGERNEFKVLK
jgi:hypothetical protein